MNYKLLLLLTIVVISGCVQTGPEQAKANVRIANDLAIEPVKSNDTAVLKISVINNEQNVTSPCVRLSLANKDALNYVTFVENNLCDVFRNMDAGDKRDYTFRVAGLMPPGPEEAKFTIIVDVLVDGKITDTKPVNLTVQK